MLKRLLSTLYESSPKALLARLRAVGHPPSTAANRVLDEILASPHFPTLLALSVSRQTKEPCILAGDPAVTGRVTEELRVRGILSEERAFSWDSSRSVLDGSAGRRIVLAQLPITAADWETVAALKRDFGANLLLLAELLLPYTRLLFLQKRLDYHVKEFDRILPIYLGEKFFGGPLDKLNALFPLDGRSIIEFGPFDGCQTAGLVHFGARPITCIEARAENATKTHTAAEIFGWDQVRVIMDDFHNADARKYGRFDLAFAHGVYYHSIAPFVFLENLRSLADNIFLGGYCATDALPTTAWSELTYEGRRFRVKEYRESDNYTSGVNETSYFMHADDLLEFFTARGHIIQTISDQTESVNAGRFLRVLIARSR